jgi:hypothetical protein
MKNLLKSLIILPALLLMSIFASPAKAEAFDPGRIIDDAVFTNKSSMSVTDIQNFLNSKVPVCDTWHPAGPSAQGATPPWICLKNYTENGKSAAQIIWEQAQNFNLNPQVLIVTLQKENGLITDTWPYPWQYRTAMGFACPDNGTCDPAYYGFTQQVYQAARHFRNFYDLNPAWYIPYSPGVKYVRWNPNSACGGSNVNIQNRATAALYSYTPYQPNAAALNNLYGTGDGCSAYGNRNFWRDFSNWFGSTTVAPYSWQFVSQTGNTYLTQTQKSTWTVSARNTGTATWSNSGSNPVRLAPSRSNDRNSAFCTSTWITCARVANLNEASVPPGSVGTFTFEVQAPANAGSYNEYFNLLAEGNTWMNDPGLFFGTTVVNGNFSSSLVSSSFPSSLASGATASGTITLKNTGNTYWYNTGKYPIRIGTYSPTDRASQFNPGNWLGSSRPAQLTESVVAPGQNGTFAFQVKAPSSNGTYQENYSLLAEGYRWFDQSIPTTITVTGGSSPVTPPASGFTGSMPAGQRLAAGQSLSSGDGKYRLVMQGDGNLVIYSPNRAIWSTNTQGRSIGFFVLQGDGNMVIYGSNSVPFWASWTQNRGGNALYMQGDGNLVLYDPQFRPIWNSGTAGRV